MFSESQFPIPESHRASQEINRYLTELSSRMTDRVVREFGGAFEVYADEPETRFGGITPFDIPEGRYWSRRIGLYRNTRLEAMVTIEWNELISGSHFRVHCRRVKPTDRLLPTLVGGLGLVGLSAGLQASGDAALGGLLLGGMIGGLCYLAWTTATRALLPGFREEVDSKLSEAILHGADGLRLAPSEL